MASKVLLMPGAAVFPDGTASNLAPQLRRVKSSAAAPGPYFYELLFDAAQREQVSWSFVLPPDYVGTPEVVVQYKMTSAVAGAVALDARLSAVTPGDATDVDAKAYGAANTLTTGAVPATAGHLTSATIPLTNADNAAAGDWVTVYLARDGAAGADTATGDLEVVSVALSYANA